MPGISGIQKTFGVDYFDVRDPLLRVVVNFHVLAALANDLVVLN